MSGRERGKKLLEEMAAKVRREVAPSGDPLLNEKGQKAVADLAADLSSTDGLPGLRVVKDTGERIRLQRPGKTAQITVEWQRPIGAIVAVTEQGGRSGPAVRYLHKDSDDEWRRMDGEGELYADLIGWLGELLYPESKR